MCEKERERERFLLLDQQGVGDCTRKGRKKKKKKKRKDNSKWGIKYLNFLLNGQLKTLKEEGRRREKLYVRSLHVYSSCNKIMTRGFSSYSCISWLSLSLMISVL